MYQIIRLKDPDSEQFHAACRLQEERFGYVNNLNPEIKREAFRRLGIELILSKNSSGIQGVCFALPETFQDNGQERSFVWLFDLVTRKEAKNIGALMLFRIMQWYPAIIGIGITDIAAKIYRALRWQIYHEVWRCVHPIKPVEMIYRYQDRLGTGLPRSLIEAAAQGGERCLSRLESLLAVYPVEKISPAASANLLGDLYESDYGTRLREVATYRNVYRIVERDQVLVAVEIDRIGRIVRDDFRGCKRFLAHASLWRELRRGGVIGDEYIVTSPRERQSAWLGGYVPLPMPIYYWDKNKVLGNFFKSLPRANFTFASCDKLL